jgi:hypothetical protein
MLPQTPRRPFTETRSTGVFFSLSQIHSRFCPTNDEDAIDYFALTPCEEWSEAVSIRLLWYPTINVPNEAWLKRVLLYTDKIGTISPGGYIRPDIWERHIEVLRDENQLEVLSAMDFLTSRRRAEALRQDALSFFQSREFRSWKKSRNRPRTKGPKRLNRPDHQLAGLLTLNRDVQLETTDESFLIHIEKLDPEVARFLEDQGLMSRVCDQYGNEWYDAEREVAHAYMSMLARHIGRYRGFVPSTDSATSERMAFNLTGPSSERHPVGSLLLSRILPTPMRETPVGEIIAFKRQREQELLQFRLKLLDIHDKLARAETSEDQQLLISRFEAERDAGLATLTRLLTESRIGFGLSSVKTLFELRRPESIMTLLGLSGTAVTTGPQQLFIGIGTIATIGISYVRTRRDTAEQVRSNPFSYVFHAQEHFGGCRPWRG